MTRSVSHADAARAPRALVPAAHAVRDGPIHPRKLFDERGYGMAAMKPRTGDGPMEVTKEGRGIIMRVPLEGGGRLVVELTPDEATELAEALNGVVG
ncbi:hypothetical protein GCM10022402_21250 [Salinactinospora qingdaonensis]